MEDAQILKLFSRDFASGDEMIIGFLEDAVATFTSNPASAVAAIRQLQFSDPSGFALASVRMLVSAEDKSPGLQYVAGLVTSGHLLIDALLDSRGLALEAAAPLARKVAAVEPLLDVQLVRKMVVMAGGDVRATKPADALHALGLVDAISDCSRLGSYLVQFLRHPSAKVRSKAALLLGRANWNLERVRNLLTAEDGRIRANAVESLRRHCEQEVQKLLWESTKDPFGRVVVNAVLELCLWGEKEAHLQLEQLAVAANPVWRSGAAWAMGETGDPAFGELLEKLKRDENAKVRAMVARSLKKLMAANPVAPPQTSPAPTADIVNA